MTRFARAKGSKASNERVPENATSWKEMKTDLVKSQQEANNKEKREAMNKQRQQNYDKFIEENKEPVNDTWVDFSDEETKNEGNSKKKQKMTKVLKKAKNNLNGKVNSKVVKAKINPKKVETVIKAEDPSDLPDEASAKVEIKNVQFQKKKNKKIPIKIPSVIPKNQQVKQGVQNKKQTVAKTPGQFVRNLVKTEESSNQHEVEQKQIKKEKGVKTPGQQKVKVNQEGKNQKPQSPKKEAPGGKVIVKQEQNQQKGQKRQFPKVPDNKEHKRRKPNELNTVISVDGVQEELVRFNGFPVRKVDADRLVELRKALIKKGIPKAQVEATIKLERRKAEKEVSRIRRKVCFQCRKSGHILSECPELNAGGQSGICFKCGSTEHTHTECKVNRSDGYKFAKCFVCNQEGHIARQCPDNPRGLYPNGGGCKLCKSVTHLKKDCPQFVKSKQAQGVSLETISSGNIESLGNEPKGKIKIEKPSPKKIVKF